MSTRSCTDIRAELSAYLDGEMDASAAAEVRAHLDCCAACRAELELQRLTVDALRRLPDLPAPAAVLTGVRARLRPTPWHRRLLGSGFGQFGFPLGAAATALVLIGASFLWVRTPETSRQFAPGQSLESPVSRQAPAAQIPVKAQARPAPVTQPAPAARRVAVGRATLPASVPVAEEDRLASAGTFAEASLDRAAKKEKAAATKLAAAESEREPLRQVQPPAPRELRKDLRAEEALRDKKSAAAPAIEAKADGGASSASTVAAGTLVPARVLLLCRLPAAAESAEDLTRLLRREGATDLVLSELEPQAVRAAAVALRERSVVGTAPARGWAMSAFVPPGALARLLGDLAARGCVTLPEQPADSEADNGLPGAGNLQITVVR